jgi:hypothetical protein
MAARLRGFGCPPIPFERNNRKWFRNDCRGDRYEVRRRCEKPALVLRILVRVETFETMGCASDMSRFQMEMKPGSRMVLRGRMPMRMQERRFGEGGQHRQAQQDGEGPPHDISAYTTNGGRSLGRATLAERDGLQAGRATGPTASTAAGPHPLMAVCHWRMDL